MIATEFVSHRAITNNKSFGWNFLRSISFPISEKLALNYPCSKRYFEGLWTCFDDLHNYKVYSSERGSKFPFYNSMSVHKVFPLQETWPCWPLEGLSADNRQKVRHRQMQRESESNPLLLPKPSVVLLTSRFCKMTGILQGKILFFLSISGSSWWLPWNSSCVGISGLYRNVKSC